MHPSLSEKDIHPDPIIHFKRWLQEAIEAGEPEPAAMILSTVASDGRPSSRAVLLKGADQEGFRFFTSYHSRKGLHLRTNSAVALVFLWHSIERQVRIEGNTRKLSLEKSRDYFHQRPRGSQLSAYISPQSQVIPSRDYLEQLKRKASERFHGKPVPLPGHWGGYVVEPMLIEFWQAGEERLHDRLQFRKEEGRWLMERLAP